MYIYKQLLLTEYILKNIIIIKVISIIYTMPYILNYLPKKYYLKGIIYSLKFNKYFKI